MFSLGKQGCACSFEPLLQGLDVRPLRVQEIRSYEQPTRIANAPPFVKDVVNLRGVIVPVIDLLRLKLACEKAEYNGFTVVVVLNVRGRVLGIVVDSVSDVLQLGADSTKAAPEIASAAASNCVTGIGCVKTGDTAGMLILMDIEALMRASDLGLMETGLH